MNITNTKYDLDTVIELSYSKLYKCLYNLHNMRYEIYLSLINLDELDDEDEIDNINITLDSVESNIEVFLEAMSIHEDFIIRQISTHDTHYEFCIN
jgi:hypothetical protein